MRFDNRPPINLEYAEAIARASRDGGAYSGIGWNTYTVYQGKRFHLVHSSNSGCDFGGGTTTERTHLGLWQTAEELADWLRQQTDEETGNFPWWCSELLEALEAIGVKTEEA